MNLPWFVLISLVQNNTPCFTNYAITIFVALGD